MGSMVDPAENKIQENGQNNTDYNADKNRKYTGDPQSRKLDCAWYFLESWYPTDKPEYPTQNDQNNASDNDTFCNRFK